MKTIIRLIITIPPLVCLSLAGPEVRAVIPPPDGGYAGFNTAEGQNALFSLTTGAANTAVGWYSLFSDTAGSFNTATGAGSLLFNTGDNNTAFGAAALLFNTTGVNNTANGNAALNRNATGNENTAIGNFALGNNTTGSSNTAMGVFAGNSVTTADNVICIGAGMIGANVSNSCFISNIRGVMTANANAIPVLIDSAGQLGTMSSSRRFKKEIKPMDSASEAILALKPVTFHYKSHTKGTPQFGLIAEEVAEVNPDLVVRDEKGELYSVRYEQVNAMLLNEFLKEHKKVEKLEATVADLAAELRQVKAQVQTDSLMLRVVAKNP